MRPVAWSRVRGRWASALLAATCLTPFVLVSLSIPAFADGGAGGGPNGGAGGADSTTGNGVSGDPGGFGGGGGGGGGAGGTGGGAGGLGAGGSGAGSAGAAGSAGGGDGGNGGPGVFPFVGGGGGGGGGGHGTVTSTFDTGGGTLRGGKGGNGGDSSLAGGGGGGGGAGGYGAVSTGSGGNTNTGTLTGGMGGHGGVARAASNGGTGGSGGAGAMFTGSSVTFTNTAGASTTGGQGGRGGDAQGIDGNGGAAGAGGDGVVANPTLTITNGGSIAGGLGNAGGSSSARSQGAASNGGQGIAGTTLSITNTGSIAGGGAGGAFGDNAAAGTGGAGIAGTTVTVTNGGSATIAGGAGGITNIGSTATGGTGGIALTATNLSLTNGGSVTGGAGGSGAGSGAGSGGGAGAAAIVAAGGSVTNSGSASITGGVGGDGATNDAGTAGGVGGVAISGTGLTITNNGSITGGAGGNGGSAVVDNGGNGGNGAAGITGASLTIVNIGSIAGGAGGFGGALGLFGFPGTSGTAGNAITFTGGNSSLELRAGSSITGNVVAQGGAGATLILGGSTSASFNSASIGAQYQNFTAFQKTGTGTWTLTGTAATASPWTVSGGLVNFAAADNFGTGQITLNGGGLQWATGTTTDISGRLAALGSSGGTIDTNGNDVTFATGLSGTGRLTKAGIGTLTLTVGSTYGGGTTINGGTLAIFADNALPTAGAVVVNGGTLSILSGRNQTIGNLSGSGGTIDLNGILTATVTSDSQLASTANGAGQFIKEGGAVLTLTGAFDIGAVAINNGTLRLASGGSLHGGGAVEIGSNGTLDLNGQSQLVGALSGGGRIELGPGGGNTLTIGPTFAGAYGGVISGAGSLAVTATSGGGPGFFTLSGSNTYTGSTTVTIGTLTLGAGGSIAASSGLTLTGPQSGFDISGSAGNQTIKDLSGVAGSTIGLGGNSLAVGTANSTTFAGAIDGNGGLTKQGSGMLTLSGTNTYTGPTTVNAGILAVNGSLASNTTVNAGGTLQGTGSITGNVTVAGTIAPGNSIGTINVIGTYTQNAGSTYTVEVNPAGQSDKIAVTGTAVLNGGTVSVQAAGGTYARNTTYTILSATGGVSGTYAGVTSNLAFLTPSLGYSGNAVTLTLLSSSNSFQSGARTPNQRAVGGALDQAAPGATGDFNTVLNALFNLDTTQGPAVLDALSGQVYAGFASLQIQSAQLFMDSFQFQAGGGSGGSAGLPGGSTYMALRSAGADACESSCDVEPLWGVWGSGLGAFGTVAGDSNGRGLSYTLGGFVAGLDRKLAPGFRAGVAAGFNAASLYPQGIPGNGTSNTLQFALYGAFNEGAFYLDALAGYGHSDNRMSRPIVIPGLNQRTAQGYTTANTFFGQLEAGYKLTVAPSFGGFVTPFARLQASTSTQAGFSETGADSLNLTVAGQTTNSLRTVLGAQLGAAIDAPWREKLNVTMRLGWSHEFADQTRPVTAAFAGAPAIGFTSQGAIAPRDGVVLGLGANTQVAERTSLYLRYDGDLAGGNTNHGLNAGVRMTW